MAGNNQDVFDVANWLDRATGRTAAPGLQGSSLDGTSAPAPTAYVPRHRADVPADSVA